MMKVFDLVELITHVAPEITARAKRLDITRRLELGFHVDDQRYRFVLSRRSARLKPMKPPRSYLRCSRSEFVQLVLGHLDINKAVQMGRVSASTGTALQLASVIFPRLPLWRPLWDDLPANDS